MAGGVYTVEELLQLRASPLICRPPSLPPTEQWMGAQETPRRAPARVLKLDELVEQYEPFQKRPTLLDNERRTTTTDPDRIVLGPPRRSFASANARTTGKPSDGSEESSNNKDRASFHEKSRNGEWSEVRHHERRNTQTNGRHGTRQEGEDQELENRRDYERRPKWAGRDRNDQELDDEQTQDDSSRPGYRRDTHSRAKLSQSWFKKDTGDALEEPKRDTDRREEWRRDRGRDRDWDRSGRVEADPEWMDSTEPEEPFQARTQEDFQRWKEKMKAGTASPFDNVESPAPVSATEMVQEKSVKKIVASPDADDSMDKFFAKFESKTAEQKPSTVKMHGKTRFASLFSPATEQNKQVEAAPPMPTMERPSSAQMPGSNADADQAGFARILEMLQTRSNNPTPQGQDTAKPRTSVHGTEARPDMEGRAPPQSLISLLTGPSAPRPQEPSPSLPPSAQDRYFDPRTPNDAQAHTRQQSSINKDEVLLNLLRQANLAPKPQPPPPNQSSEMRGPPGMMMGMPPDPTGRAAASRGQLISPVPGQDPPMIQRREAGRSMYDVPMPSSYPNDQGPREPLSRRTTNGGQAGFPEDPLIALLRQQNPQQRQMQASQPPQALPPGLPRPPGLDQIPRQNPNWPPQQPQPQPQQQQSQQQPPRQPPPPPGLANLPRGMPGAPFGGQPQQMNQQPPPQQQQRPQPPPSQQQQQRKYTGDSSANPGGMPPLLPPGMYPPPGFMNAGPPPGFPGAMPNHPTGRFQGEPPGPPQGLSRAFVDAYGGELGGRGLGLRGGAGTGGMPPYR